MSILERSPKLDSNFISKVKLEYFFNLSFSLLVQTQMSCISSKNCSCCHAKKRMERKEWNYKSPPPNKVLNNNLYIAQKIHIYKKTCLWWTPNEPLFLVDRLVCIFWSVSPSYLTFTHLYVGLQSKQSTTGKSRNWYNQWVALMLSHSIATLNMNQWF